MNENIPQFKKVAVIIGAGPAGLTAALELLRNAPGIKPVIFEASEWVGGISKTLNYKGNRIDLGGHRFFSKSDSVMDWWKGILPIEGQGAREGKSEKVLLVRKRLSRIFFLGRFFDYPIALNWQTVRYLGLRRIIRIGLSYLRARFAPLKEKSLEDFFINRFGAELYRTFFKDYTEKLWGVPCESIPATWGAQRVKGLSVAKALRHFFESLMPRKRSLEQKKIETSLIDSFLYPKLGPGQLWEEAAERIRSMGGEIFLRHEVVGINWQGSLIVSVKIRSSDEAREFEKQGDYFFSTMPVKDLVASFSPAAPSDVQAVAAGLCYRDFLTVGLLLKKLSIPDGKGGFADRVEDTWLYIQEKDVRIGRMQIFNNWSPYMVKDPEHTVWAGLEYFCNEGDDIWKMPDARMAEFAIAELEKIHIIRASDVLDSVVFRQPKAYPAYFGTYPDLPRVRAYLDAFQNLFLVGRNGMHRYNNQDHSMLTAMEAVKNIVENRAGKDNIWQVNTEAEYHESK